MNILIADDDNFSRRYLSATLGKWGFGVIEAVDGTEAWKIFQSPNSPSIAIVDWFMPGLDGLDVVRRLRATHQVVPAYILMLTGQHSEHGLSEAFEAGADEYITKPFKPAELKARIKAGVRVTNLQRSLNKALADLDAAQAAVTIHQNKVSPIKSTA